MPRILPLLASALVGSAVLWSCMSGQHAAAERVGEQLPSTPTVLQPVQSDEQVAGPRIDSEPAVAETVPSETATATPTQPAEPQPLRLSIPRGKPSFPATTECGNTMLVLQGAGLCEWGFLGIDLYRGAFYVERKVTSADEALRADQRMVVHLDFVRALSKDQLSAAWTGSAEVNTKGDPHDHGPALRQLCDAMRDVDDGDSYSFVLTPSDGTRVLRNGSECAHIDDEAFRRLFVKLYLGPDPPTKALRKAMLGDAK